LQEPDYDDDQNYHEQEVNEIPGRWYGKPAEQPQDEQDENDRFQCVPGHKPTSKMGRSTNTLDAVIRNCQRFSIPGARRRG
jgi:hypothetical protein